MNTPRRAAAAALALVLVTAACGDDDDDATETTEATEATTETTEATTDTTEVTDTTEATETTAATDTTEATDTTDATGTTEASVDAVAFSPPDGSYTVVMPGEPEEINQDVPLPDGTTLPLTMFMYQTRSAAYGVATSTYPEGTVTSLDGARDGAVSNVGGTLVSSEPVTLQGREGVDFVATIDQGGQPGIYHGRIFLDGLALYQLVFVGAEGSVPDDEVTAFLDSFQFAEG